MSPGASQWRFQAPEHRNKFEFVMRECIVGIRSPVVGPANLRDRLAIPVLQVLGWVAGHEATGALSGIRSGDKEYVEEEDHQLGHETLWEMHFGCSLG